MTERSGSSASVLGKSSLTTVAFLVLLVAGASAQDRAHYRKTHDGYHLADPEVTKGGVAHSDKATICNTKWGKDARHVTEKMKRDVYTAYHARKRDKVCCEVDHLVSRDVGGADEPANLWPQPWAEAHLKDRVETEAKKRICDGRAELEKVQRTMAEDWTLLYRDWFGDLPKRR
jgi:hypothetical protein